MKTPREMLVESNMFCRRNAMRRCESIWKRLKKMLAMFNKD